MLNFESGAEMETSLRREKVAGVPRMVTFHCIF